MNRRQSPETEAMRPPEQADKKIKLTEYFGIGNREQTQRKQFIWFAEEDAAILRRMLPLIQKHAGDIVEQFYAQLLKFPETRCLFNDEALLKRLKGAQQTYLIELFQGEYGEEYFEKRLQIGVAHERIGLTPKWYLGSSGNILSMLVPLVTRHYRWNIWKQARALRAVVKIINLDQQSVMETYVHFLVERLNESKAQIQETSAVLVESAQEILAAVSETTTTVEEVRQTSLLASQKARTVFDNTQRAAQNAESGRKATEEAVAGMSQIRQQMEAIEASMLRLSEQSQAIGQIIATVDDLAAQSNLLAVNAAIEAAKAGEHGKGFGVVAQEVKSLAVQSRQATKQVRTILNDIQKATAAAVMATGQGSTAVAAGEQQTAAAGESIEALAGSVTEAAQATTQIAASSQQQLIGMQQVVAAMESIKQASARNMASAKHLEASTAT